MKSINSYFLPVRIAFGIIVMGVSWLHWQRFGCSISVLEKISQLQFFSFLSRILAPRAFKCASNGEAMVPCIYKKRCVIPWRFRRRFIGSLWNGAFFSLVGSGGDIREVSLSYDVLFQPVIIASLTCWFCFYSRMRALARYIVLLYNF